MADVVALPVEELNRLVQLGHRRVAQLEPRLAALLEPIFVQYGDEAAERFVSQTKTLAAAGSRESPRGVSDAPGTSEVAERVALAAAADWNPPMADELVDVDRLVADLRTKTDPVRLGAIEAMMGPILEGSGLSFDPHNPHAARVLQQSGSQVTHVAATTRENVRRIITASYKEGLTIPDTAKAIRGGMRAASTARATLIARTELVGAVNGGSLAAVNIVDEASGVRHVKVWLTGPGARYPRHELYLGLEGQTVGMDEYFIVGFDELLYPGDPDGSPEEVCNCRCAISYEEEAGQPHKDSPAPGEGAPATPAEPVAPEVASEPSGPLTDGPATAALDSTFADWGASLTREEINALYTYRETVGFEKINTFLREGGSDPVVHVADEIPGATASEVVAQIDAVVARAPASPVDLDMLVFRGIRDKNALFGGVPKVGDTFVDHAYTSTTTEFKIASQRYTKEIGAPVSAPNPNAAVLEVEVPKGTRGAWMRANDALEDQGNREFVLGRDTEFRIVQVSEREKYEGDPSEMITVVRVQVVPKAADAQAEVVTSVRGGSDTAAALEYYHSPKAFEINDALRNGKALTAEQAQVVATLDRAFAPLADAKRVYRGLPNLPDVFGGRDAVQLRNDIARHGESFESPAFTSTTATKESAVDFSYGIADDNDQPFLFRIELPEGTPALRVPEGDYGNQDEWLLPRGMRLELKGVLQADSDLPIVLARVVPRQFVPPEPPSLAHVPERVGWAPAETRFSVVPPEPDGWQAWRASLNGDQLDAVYRYTSEGGFKELNAAMRGEAKMTGELVELRDRLTEAVRSAPRFDGEVTVWRGVDLGSGGDLGAEAVGLSREARDALAFEKVADLAENQFQVGETVTFDSFQSTTTFTDPALDAALAPKHPGVIFEIRTSEGALIKPPLTKYDDEAEILLGPGTRFRVEGVLRAADFEKGDYGDTVRRTVVQLRALPSPRLPEPLAPPRSLGTRPWLHYKDSTLVTQIGRQRKALQAAEKAGDTAAAQDLRIRVDELLQEQGIRRGKIAELRPWEHYKDSTLTTQIGRQRRALEAATSDAERARLENRVAELLREKDIRKGATGNTGTVVVKKPEVVKAAVRKSESAARRAVAEPETRTFDPNTPAPQAELLRAAGVGMLRRDVLYRTEDGPSKWTPQGTHQARPGWVAVVEDMPIFIEESSAWDAATVMRQLSTQFAKLRKGSPDMYSAVMENTSRVNVWAAANPADDFWAKAYNTPGFTSAATGGGGAVDFWQVGGSQLARGDRGYILYHELGHEIGVAAGPPEASAWRAAMRADKEHGSGLVSDATFKHGDNYRYDFRIGRDAVSAYGENNEKEDWAESIRLYLQEKTGYAPPGSYGSFQVDPFRMSTHRPALFADLYPARARMIEDFLQGGYY